MSNIGVLRLLKILKISVGLFDYVLGLVIQVWHRELLNTRPKHPKTLNWVLVKKCNLGYHDRDL